MATKILMKVQISRVKLADSGPGPIRAVIAAADRNGLALYKKTDRVAILRTALETAGAEWIAKYLPLRFQPYARTIGYVAKGRGGGKPAKIQPTSGRGRLVSGAPLTRTGALGAVAMDGATAKGLAGGNPRVKIRIPLAHRLRAQELAVLNAVPEKEVRAIAQALDRALQQAFAGAGAVLLPQPASGA